MVANFTALGLLFFSLLFFSYSPASVMALLLALAGSLLALAGAALVVICHGELGAAWSFAPKADPSTGLITSGPYRLVRHPIYLGLTLLALGQAVAFGCWPALFHCTVGGRPDPGLARPHRGEMLSRIFGESYEVYRQQPTKMIVPYLLQFRCSHDGRLTIIRCTRD